MDILAYRIGSDEDIMNFIFQKNNVDIIRSENSVEERSVKSFSTDVSDKNPDERSNDNDPSTAT